MSVARRFFPKPAHQAALAELAAVGGATARGEGTFTDIAALDEAGPDDITFFTNNRYLETFKASKAGGCILSPGRSGLITNKPLLISGNPRLTFAKVCKFFYPSAAGKGDSPPKIDKTARIHETAVVESGADIGEGVTIGANSYIGYNCLVGNGCTIGNNVSISYAQLAAKVSIQSNTTVGEEGFGFAVDEGGRFFSIPHLGKVSIGEDSQIAAGCSIVRGSMKDTIIGDGCRIDAQVQIAHNVVLGQGVIISAQVGISGSTRIDDFARIGGQSGIMGHLHIGAKARVFPKSGVMANVNAGESVGGAPAIPLRQFLRYSKARAK